MDVNTDEVGFRIREIRKETLGLSMADFAEKIDGKAKSGTVSNWETGKNLPNNERIKRIAELGNISVDELLYGNIANEVTRLEAFIDYLKSIGLPVRIEEEGERSHQVIDINDKGQEIGIITVPNEASFVIIDEANGISVHYTEEEFKALQQTMKETVEYQLWKKQNN